VNFSYFVENNQGLSFARNRGIDEAKGDILVYVDDDATVNEEYLETISDFFKNEQNAMAAGGAIFPVYETAEPAWMSHFTKILITAYKNEGSKIIEFKGKKFPGGGNAAYRKDVFEKVGKFNPELGRKGTSLLGAEEKAIFDKMKALKMPVYYLPNMILYHIISPVKLTKEYFNILTFSMGQSERLRTLSISRIAYFKRLFSELIKWGASLVLFVGFCFKLQPQKGTKLLLFRWNVTKGLLKNTI
jgi:glycosyltransferase involved in cell wall biosynthesis